jgi:hypothetical protein
MDGLLAQIYERIDTAEKRRGKLRRNRKQALEFEVT